ncbi:helix-turn-helix transcriptional regulator [uncultured Ruegeria sp.]|uniref:helix-turn-helix transcriptional regulator n=1 Tax=uncultured Ruegeria sp. TaxID=259304 RepID=UPI002618643E|nr:helix-turn-helix transcriptional regulator [uncultured Ruegeria sp.]
MRNKIHIMYQSVNTDNSQCEFSFPAYSCKNRVMNNLARYRELKGLSQRDLAEVLKVSQPTIQRAESEAPSAKLETYKLCANYFGITLSDIFSDRTEVEDRFLQMLREVPDQKLDQVMGLIELAKSIPPEGAEEANQTDDPQET